MINHKVPVKIIYLLYLFLISVTSHVYSQKGTLTGTVKDKNLKETLAGANVVIEGTTTGTITDFDGMYTLENLPAGFYNIKFSFISYNPVVIEKVKIETSKTTVLNVELEEVTTQLEGVTVTAVRRTNTDIAMISSIKTAGLVTSGISGQQILKSQDRDASEVIRRVPGISIIDDRFVIVRGLNQRYNNVWLNNSATPSSETDSRAFSFDVIPSSMIDNILVYKTPSPELPADWAGGFIKIFTKNMPEENSTTIGYSISWEQNSTLKDFYSIDGSNTDFLGFDNKVRPLPKDFPKNLSTLTDEQIIENGKKLNHQWVASQQKALPGQKLSLGLNRKFGIGKMSVGTITAVNYSNTYNMDEISNVDFQTYNFINDKPVTLFDFTDMHYTNSVKTGILHNWSLFAGKGHKIEFRNLFNQTGNDKVIFRNGEDNNNGYIVRSYGYRYMSRTTYSSQLGGEHALNQNNTKINWTASLALANRNEPDLKQLQSTLITDPLNPHQGEYGMSINQFVDPSRAGRIFMKTREHIYSFSINLSHKINIGNFKPELSSGIYYEPKNRIFDARLIGYRQGRNYDFNNAFLPFDQLFSNDNLNTSTGIYPSEATSKSDSYKATNRLMAVYVGTKIPVGPLLTIYTGIRSEWNRQYLSGWDKQQNKKKITNNNSGIFPSINITYDVSEKSLVRLAYGKTINRPEFREIAPFHFYNFEENKSYQGYVDLKDAIIHNVDARYELYPDQGETFSIGVFYKKFIHPIELKFINIGGGSPAFTYQNAESAVSAGAEIEIRKSLQFIDWLQKFSLAMNASYIKSKVNFPDSTIERNRPMQGQSPYLINVAVFYQDDDHGLNIGFLYNIIGKRIVAVGEAKQNIADDIPDIIEMPRNLVDISVSKKIGKLELKIGVKDLFNQDVVYRQTVKFMKDGHEVERYQYPKIYSPGRIVNVGINYAF